MYLIWNWYDNLALTQNWLCSLCDIFWIFLMVCSECFRSYRLWLTVTIESVELVSEPLLILILGEGYFQSKLKHRCILSIILNTGFGVGELRFNSTLYGQFICHQSYTPSIKTFYERGSLSVFFSIQFILPSITIYYIRRTNIISINYKRI